MGDRVAILRKYNFPLEEMAQVLEKEPEEIDPSTKVTNKEGHARHHVAFDHPFEFQTQSISKATVNLELKGSDKSGHEQSFGVVSKGAKELAGTEEFTFQSGAIMKVRLQLLHLG